MIEVRELSYRYRRGADPALQGVSLEVHRGERLLILGPNGAGKTTLAKHLNGLLQPDQGEVRVDGLLANGEGLWEVRRRVGLLFQNPVDQIVGNSLIEEVAFGPENFNLPPEEIARRAEGALGLVGLSKKRNCSPNELSGGELQRLAIAGIWAMEPDYLVCDEPFVQIDARAQAALLRVLGRLKADGRGIVLISQDTELIEHADRIALLRDGRLLGWGRPGELFQDESVFARAGLWSPQLLRLYYALKNKLNFASPPLSVEALAKQLEPRLEPRSATSYQPSASDNSSHARLRTCPRANVLQLEDLSFSYNRGRPSEVQALQGISLEIEEGSLVGITGPSGSGKSTLVQQLAGLLRPDSGTARFRGQEISGPLAEVGLVFQNPLDQLFAEDLHREITYGLRARGLSREESGQRARRACTAVGLDYERHKHRSPFTHSEGEQVKLCIATTLALEPEVLILDETLTPLDPPSREELIQHLLRLNREGMTIIFVSHRLGELLGELDRLFILDGGRLVASGEPRELLGRPELELPQVTRLMLQLGLPPAFAVDEALLTLRPLLSPSIL